MNPGIGPRIITRVIPILISCISRTDRKFCARCICFDVKPSFLGVVDFDVKSSSCLSIARQEVQAADRRARIRTMVLEQLKDWMTDVSDEATDPSEGRL